MRLLYQLCIVGRKSFEIFNTESFMKLEICNIKPKQTTTLIAIWTKQRKRLGFY